MIKKQYNITCVIGTRPEALKMAPVIQALSAKKKLNVNTLLTAQHRDLLDQVLQYFDLKPVADFNVMSDNQQLTELTAKLLNKFSDYFKDHPCDLMIAQGDTTTTMIAALAAFYQKIPFVHVEAGLRTNDIYSPFPEELNRRIVSQIATIHCCPTDVSVQNLFNQGITKGVYETGNTIIDTLYSFTKHFRSNPLSDTKTILVTCHRRENFGAPLHQICAALKQIVEKHTDVQIIFPVHPNPNVKKIVYEHLSSIDRITLTEPMDYQALTEILASCYCVLTDSGGLQEEAPALGKPVLVLREETERPEGVLCGAAKVVGTRTDNIVAQTDQLLTNVALYAQMSTAGSPYGDGKSSERIAQIICQYLIPARQSLQAPQPRILNTAEMPVPIHPQTFFVSDAKVLR